MRAKRRVVAPPKALTVSQVVFIIIVVQRSTLKQSELRASSSEIDAAFEAFRNEITIGSVKYKRSPII
jgi:hypothetical protein